MSRPAMRQVLIRMPAEMNRALKADATANDRTVAATVRRAIRSYLESERKENA